MSTIQPLLAGYLNPLRVVDSADFDGSNDWMTRGAGLTGAADSKTGILSYWARIDVDQTGNIVESNSARVNASWVNAPDAFYIQMKDTAGSINLNINSGIGLTSSATWHHILASWDLATTTVYLYRNDVSDLTTTTIVDSTIDYTDTDWGIGATVGGAGKLSACLAEVYFAPGQYLDFSIVAHRRKFISPLGKPVHLGTTGALPTGTAPLIYLHLDDAEAVANLATNRGTGGNFTITGTLDTGSTSPSD